MTNSQPGQITLKEILQQPKLWPTTLERIKLQDPSVFSSLAAARLSSAARLVHISLNCHGGKSRPLCFWPGPWAPFEWFVNW
jgi:hypothetical protein